MANGNGLTSFKEKLRNVKKILFTKHAIVRCEQRELTQKEIENYILNAQNLFKVVPEKADLSDEEKYRLYFRLSRNKTLLIVTLRQPPPTKVGGMK